MTPPLRLAAPSARLSAGLVRWCRIPFPALALAVCLLFAAAGVAVLDDYGVGADAPDQRRLAEQNAAYIMGDGDALPTYHDKFYGIAFELPLLLAERLLGLQDNRDIYLSRHLLTHLFFIAGGFFCGLLVWRMFGSRRLALLAMLLFLLHPRLYAHSFFNSKDIPFAVMFVIALYLTHRAFRRDAAGAFALLGLVVGLAANMRPFALLLLPAVLALRGLDWRPAAGGDARRRILLTAGVFAAATLLAIYVSQPFYWENPWRFIDGLQTLSRHPYLTDNLFQGRIVPADAAPADYLPVWFGITAPPATLLLGALGVAAVGRWAFREPRRALRRGELRFCVMLLGCLALPVAVVIILQPHIYNGWRQMYFLWGPFCLLAAAGGHYIHIYLRGFMRNTLIPLLPPGKNGGGIRCGNLWSAAMYAAAAAAAGSALYAIVSLHPHQQLYFNPLVDRETPESLREQFELDYWGVSYREGLEYLLQRYPEMPLRIPDTWRSSIRSVWILPAAERQRIHFVSPEQADFHFAGGADRNANGAPPGALMHAVKVYNNTIFTVRATEPAAATPDGLAEIHRAGYEALAVGELLAKGELDIHISKDGANLVYAKAGCALGDMAAQFFLHLFPADERDLPPGSGQRGYENRVFRFFDGPGGISEGRCATQTSLPDYPVARIRAGQYTGRQGNLWQSEFPARVLPHLAEYRAIASGGYRKPAARGYFEVYSGENRLIYFREQCSAADRAAKFYLHIVPQYAADLPEYRRQYGFDNLDFRFAERGTVLDGNCGAIAPLPDYPIDRIRTGQYSGSDQLWRAELPGQR